MTIAARTPLVLLLVLGGCARPDSLSVSECAARPPGFLTQGEFLAAHPASFRADLVSNSLRLDAAGGLAWNGARVSGAEAEALLRQVAAQDPPTSSYLHFTWDRKAPCANVAGARTMIDRHLACAASGRCIEGPAPRLFPPPPTGRRP
ncbi:hypothetical protein ACLBKU_17165 [Erythrobacter sp. NE805]|uniref:hypothetical protein n=1 Tax=Erythrobacter sp. NE805 TaxID=3389875 RepID=UPI00396B42F5